MRWTLAAVLLAGCVFSIMVFGSVMGLFGKKITVYPFSGFSGHLLYKGSPAAGAKVTRSWDWDGTKHEETVVASDIGEFSFDAIKVETRESLYEFVSSQRVVVEHKGENYTIWVCSKRLTELYGEFGAEPKHLNCEITNELHDIDLERGLAVSNCTWDN